MARFDWPDGRICAVALSFDMDGETIPFVADPPNARKRLTLLSESMYGPNVGMPRILRLLDLYELKATFFVPGFTAELHPDVLERVLDEGHELGAHGYMHERPDTLSDEEEEAVLVRSIEVQERLTGRRPVGYRSPAWELKPTTPALLRKHGFLYDTSLMGDDVPYRIEAGDGELIELPVQWILDDWPHFGFSAVPPLGTGISSPEKVFEVWSSEFDGMHKAGSLVALTLHPFVIGRPGRMLLLERFIRYMRGHPRVWFTTLEEIARHCADTGKGKLVRFPEEVLAAPPEEPAPEVAPEE